MQSTITPAVKGFKTTISDLQKRIGELLAENRMILENVSGFLHVSAEGAFSLVNCTAKRPKYETSERMLES